MNPFAPHLRSFAPGDWLESLRGAPLPMPVVQPWWPQDAPLPHRVACLPCDGLQIVALEGPPLFVDLISSGWAVLLLVVEGDLELIQGACICRARAGDCLLVPAGLLAWRSGAYSLVAVLVPPWCLQAAFDALAPGLEQGAGGALEALRLIAHGAAAEAPLLAVLQQVMASIALLQADSPRVLDRLGFAEQLVRLLVMMGWPELLAPAADQPVVAASGPEQGFRGEAHAMAESFEALLAFIRDHLDWPLSLAVLERQSNYSRRSLQYAFKEHLGCTATQWIRAQRLDRAYQRLIQAGPEDSVAGIAQACGYRTMGLFSVEFQQRFHVKPSLLLRQARSAASLPAAEAAADGSAAATADATAAATPDGARLAPDPRP